MIRILKDARTQTRRFACLVCGTEFVADFEEVNTCTGHLKCPVCKTSMSWSVGDIVYDDIVYNKEEKG